MMREKYIVISGIKPHQKSEEIFIRQVGKGEKYLLLIPGNNTSGRIFSAMFNAFAINPSLNERYTLLTFDYRGSGKSSYNTRIASIADFAIDFNKVINSIPDLPTENIALLGYSMGFAVALEMALLNPNRYSQLIGLAPVGTRGSRVKFEAHNAGTTESRKQYLTGDYIPIEQNGVGIEATAFHQRSWQGENLTAENVKNTWNMLVFNDILKYNTQDLSLNDTEFLNSPNYANSIDDNLSIRYMPESLYFTHKFNISSKSIVPKPNHDGTSVTIQGSDKIKDHFKGKEILLIKAKTDFKSWRGDIIITDEIITETKNDLKESGAFVTSILIDPDQGYDHGLAATKPQEILTSIDIFISGRIDHSSAEKALKSTVTFEVVK